jgi:hypothetical protein
LNTTFYGSRLWVVNAWASSTRREKSKKRLLMNSRRFGGVHT